MKKKSTEAPEGVAAGGAGTSGIPELPAESLPDDAVFRDIVRKATGGDIKYQELYLKYIDLISARTADEDEVIYEATFIDDKDKEA